MEPINDAPIANRVAESAIETLDLAALAPTEDVVAFDLAPFLYRGLVLREREFRQALKDHDWTAYQDRDVAVFCSADALVPTWAFMLVAAKLSGAASVAAAPPEDVRRARFATALDAVDWDRFANAPVVVKGCGNDVVPLDGFVQVTRRLQGVAAKVMYGEACSSVPVWRRPAPAAPSGAGRPVAVKRAGVKPAGVKPAGPRR